MEKSQDSVFEDTQSTDTSNILRVMFKEMNDVFKMVVTPDEKGGV